jgi:Caspase domain
MGMKRRDFLAKSGFLGAAFTLSNFLIDATCNRAAWAIAAPTSRKLALLIGINQYPDQPLKGCLTDVDLQRELLIYRCGFQPSDILVLCDRAATADAIALAYQNHVIEQAKPGDRVLLHFSGYGRFNLLSQAEWLTLDTGYLDAGRITEAQLLSWLKATPTDQITTVMDTSYYYPNQRPGILRHRSRPAQVEIAAEGDRIQPPAALPGWVLRACDRNQVATERDEDDWSAGRFTYALTQRLWQMIPPTSQTILFQQVSQDLSRSVETLQQPQVRHPTLTGNLAGGNLAGSQGGRTSQKAWQGFYGTEMQGTAAAGALQQRLAETGVGTIWLGGLAAPIVDQVQSGTIFQTVEPEPKFLQVLDRNGLSAKVRLSTHGSKSRSSPPAANSVPNSASNSTPNSTLPPAPIEPGSSESFAPGTLIQEAIRLLPRKPELLIALDPQLAKIEKVDAISALSNLPQVDAIATGESHADYLLAKAVDRAQQQIALLPNPTNAPTANPSTAPSVSDTPAALQTSPAIALIPPASYALFSLAKSPLTHTIGEPGEAVKVAIKRLAPTLKTLLAQKLLHLMENAIATYLSLEATLESVAPEPQLLLRQVSGQAFTKPGIGNLPSPDQEIPKIAVGSRLRFFLTNQSIENLYWLLISWDIHRDPYIILPLGTFAKINPGMGQPLMSSPANPEWIVRAPAGLAESLLLCSTQPFAQTQILVAQEADNFLHTIDQPLDLVQAILQDLQAASPAAIELASNERVALDVRTWAGFRFQYQVV